ncbi:MAG: heme-copper oxidase subunit III [Caldilineaceae bacterium]|nr:heme-copper oxidase subunit III [Caldilineaceae bacterium]
MSALAADAIEVYRTATRNNRMGMWLFFFSELFLFGGLLITRFALWVDEEGHIIRPELDQNVGLIVTVVLLASSYFMNRSEVAIAHGRKRDFLVSLWITGFLGVVFLLGVVIFEWGLIQLPFVEHHIGPTDGVFGAVIFGMTGMHAIHVITGVAFIVVVWRNGRRDVYTEERHWGVEACAIYWHYVDLVWIFFYPAIYLIGHAVH